jgi:Domain of unknown function (DUF6538)
MRVPKELLTVVGRAELKYSLNTASLRLAKRKSKETSRKVKRLFNQLRGRDMELTEDQIDEIVRAYIRDFL